MKILNRALWAILLWAGLAAAQVVPGRYVVELTGEPLGAAVRSKGKAALADRHARILSEQTRAKAAVESQGAVVVSSTDGVINALLVWIPDDDAAALSSLPGVKKVYPVHEVTMHLDHALPIHYVPYAWARVGGMDKAGAGVKIGILDTGISPDHPAFQDPSLKPPPGYPKASKPENLALTNSKIIVARSYEDIYRSKDPDNARDLVGHGTGTAMCAAGVMSKGPFATITGVAPKAWIGGYKIVSLSSGSAATDVIVKAMDDALADGMDVINLSFGSPFVSRPGSLEAIVADRMARFGVVMVVSAGNAGPRLNTIGDFAGLASVISVGASENDRTFGGSVSFAGGTPYKAVPGRGSTPNPTSAISTPIFDASSVDSTGLVCTPLPAGSATGSIALILRGTCTFEEKLNDAQAGGAIAAIVYDAAGDAVSFSTGAATIPAVMLSHADGLALKAAVAGNPSASATLIVDGLAYAQASNRLASFTSRGPNWDFTIKPDLAAVGTNVYMARQSVNPNGAEYSQDGYGVASGTSFSSPITAGAAAVLRAARPGLTVDQYRSLLINSAAPFARPDGWVERVQQTGAGILNLDAALMSTVTAFPTSLTFGVGSGILGGSATGDFNQLTLTNAGKTSDTFTLSAIPFDDAPALQFSTNPADGTPASSLSLAIDPGQSRTAYAFWNTNRRRLAGGEYQGQIVIEGAAASTSTLVPYWHGVPTNIPSVVFVLNSPGTRYTAGTTVAVYVRVTDAVGIPITDSTLAGFKGSATGGGSITLVTAITFPDLFRINLKLGPSPGENKYQFSFGNLPPVSYTITGAAPNP